MSVREAVGALARAAVGNFRTNSDTRLRILAIHANPQLSTRAVNTLITAAFRTNRAMRRNARSGFESR